jgi:hypothetical protein
VFADRSDADAVGQAGESHWPDSGFHGFGLVRRHLADGEVG